MGGVKTPAGKPASDQSVDKPQTGDLIGASRAFNWTVKPSGGLKQLFAEAPVARLTLLVTQLRNQLLNLEGSGVPL